MKLRVYFAGNSEPVNIITDSAHTFAQAVWLSGVAPPPLCSGLGVCGRCRVRFLGQPPAPVPAEMSRLSESELAEGWRLACRHTVVGDAEIFVPTPAAAAARPLHTAPTATALLLAVDLGTTSLQWRALTPQGQTVLEGQEINPHMGAGAELMSRLAYAQNPAARLRLAHLTQEALRRIVRTLPVAPREICLAANTAMTAITLACDSARLATAPYSIPYAGDSYVYLDGLPPVYIPPQPAPFVGGDVSAGMLCVQHLQDIEYPFLFMDMGTNGECVLALSPQHSLLASVPLGPALEGVGLACGGMAGTDTPGAVTAFRLSPQGLLAITLGQAAPTHICAVGYISLLHILLRLGVLDENGLLQRNPPTPLGKRLAGELCDSADGLRLNLPGELHCSARDVEEFLKVKAAFSWAVASLLNAAGLRPADLRKSYLAGALGLYADTKDLRALGFIPEAVHLHILGNTSLEGAQRLLLHPEERPALARWSAASTTLDLTRQGEYMQQFLQHMRFKSF